MQLREDNFRGTWKLRILDLLSIDLPRFPKQPHRDLLHIPSSYTPSLVASPGGGRLQEKALSNRTESLCLLHVASLERKERCGGYDYNRVVLDPLPDSPDSTTSTLPMSILLKPKAYVATQGPLENTIADFWRMGWQEKTDLL
ncbi:receptor-type tyrosine-protein phosphatase H-like [Penaeus monodon]|uniref:receptor-type tyrosine-protein phosphatase H-like n=1 Tax=Penaeus monodon TaxID=6687 RepID=UPI0018A7C02C|nr:receptor-type tyrosine-protein phosphatase H-like [Penaeus monodon]